MGNPALLGKGSRREQHHIGLFMGNKKKYTIGIDIGGTKILACLLDANFRVVSEFKIKTKPDKGERYFRKSLADVASHILREAKVSHKEVIGIGIGCPGFINPAKGMITGSPNIPFLKNYPLAKRITQMTGLPVTLGND